MKLILIACLAGAFFFASCSNDKKEDKKDGTTTVSSDDKDKMKADPCAGYVPDSAGAPPMESAMMAMWMANATPGEMHAMLAKANGEWEAEVTSWMDPAAPPTKSKSSATNKMILGGRFQMSEHTGCFGGMPFEGISIVGYDNARKVFNSTWMDNMGTMVMNLEGTWDAANKTIHLAGRCTNPMGGGMMNVREDFTLVDDNTQKMIMWGPDMKGKEYKTMEITFTRKK
jgi:hypothetical protein